MAPKSNNQKKAEALAAGKAPKKTKQQENAGQVCNPFSWSLSQSNLSSLVCQAEEGGDEEQEEGRCREEVRMVEMRERHAGKPDHLQHVFSVGEN